MSINVFMDTNIYKFEYNFLKVFLKKDKNKKIKK